MGIRASAEAIPAHLEGRILEELESNMPQQWGLAHVSEYEYDIGKSWRTFMNVFTNGAYDKKSELEAYDSPAVWSIRGRHLLREWGPTTHYNSPADVDAIQTWIESWSDDDIEAALRVEQQALYEGYLAEGIPPDRARGLFTDQDREDTHEAWRRVAAFYRRAAQDGHFVVCEIG